MTQKTITIVPYDPEWPAQFEAERQQLIKILGENCLAIHHIGSTAIPGLSAKARIDIIIEAHKPAQTIAQLKSIGFEYMGEFNIPLHWGFRRRTGTEVNLHVYPIKHPEIELNLTFRDYLRSYPAARDAYQVLKHSLAANDTNTHKTHNNLSEYSLKKGAFIRSILAQAGFSRLRVVKCSDEAEWKFVRQKIEIDRRKSYFIMYKGVTMQDAFCATAFKVKKLMENMLS